MINKLKNFITSLLFAICCFLFPDNEIPIGSTGPSGGYIPPRKKALEEKAGVVADSNAKNVLPQNYFFSPKVTESNNSTSESNSDFIKGREFLPHLNSTKQSPAPIENILSGITPGTSPLRNVRS